MEEIIFDLDIRSETGSTASKELRHQDIIPGVIYGAGKPSQMVKLSRRDFRAVMRQHGEEAILFKLSLKDNGKEVDTCFAIIQEMQFDAVSDQIIHIDFKRTKSRLEAAKEASAVVEHAAEVTNPVGEDDLEQAEASAADDSVTSEEAPAEADKSSESGGDASKDSAKNDDAKAKEQKPE